MEMNLKFDPEFKALVPPLSSEEYSQLEENLKKETNPDSIILTTWDGTLIDGHHRYEICQKHNISFRTVEKEFADRDEVKIWIINNQLGRRNIPMLAKIDLASKKQDILELKERAKQRMVEASHPKRDNNVAFQNSEKQPRKEINKVNITKKIAEETKLSTDTVSWGLQILKKAPEELKQKALKGEASINEAYIEVRKKELQEEAVQENKQRKLQQEIQTPEPRINPEWEELEKKRPGEACAYDPTSVIDEVVLCPCGCGCGFYRALQTENDRWYLKDELNKLNCKRR